MKRNLLGMVVVGVLIGAGSVSAQEREGFERHRQPFSGVPAWGAFREPKPLAINGNLTGYVMTGTRVNAYELACDSGYMPGCDAIILRSRLWASAPYGMVSVSHIEDAKPYLGKRIELSGDLRAGGLDGWAGMWVRVDTKAKKPVAFDNMQNRPIEGTTSYERHRVILDVPLNAERLYMGVMLHGPGAVFIRDLRLRIVDDSEPLTDMMPKLKKDAQGGAVAAP